MMIRVISVIAYLLLAPLIGGLLEGCDRKISARMQGRIGPSILQPFYDVRKLFNKQFIIVNRAQTFLVLSYMISMVFTGCLFFAGTDILLCFFALSTAATFLIFASSVTYSPYSSLGSSRELVQMMSYEPAVLMTCVGFYLADRTFNVSDIIQSHYSSIVYLPGFFIAYIFILTIKMRKSPFDISSSHHPHQELVKGITTEMGADILAMVDITEWYENVFLLGVVAIFIVNSNPVSYIFAILVVLAVYFLEILIDNTCARVKWNRMLEITWICTLLSAGLNLFILMLARV